MPVSLLVTSSQYYTASVDEKKLRWIIDKYNLYDKERSDWGGDPPSKSLDCNMGDVSTPKAF